MAPPACKRLGGDHTPTHLIDIAISSGLLTRLRQAFGSPEASGMTGEWESCRQFGRWAFGCSEERPSGEGLVTGHDRARYGLRVCRSVSQCDTLAHLDLVSARDQIRCASLSPIARAPQYHRRTSAPNSRVRCGAFESDCLLKLLSPLGTSDLRLSFAASENNSAHAIAFLASACP
jgi:hypothetical protein